MRNPVLDEILAVALETEVHVPVEQIGLGIENDLTLKRLDEMGDEACCMPSAAMVLSGNHTANTGCLLYTSPSPRDS